MLYQAEDDYPVGNECDADAHKKWQEEPDILRTSTWHVLTDCVNVVSETSSRQSHVTFWRLTQIGT